MNTALGMISGRHAIHIHLLTYLLTWTVSLQIDNDIPQVCWRTYSERQNFYTSKRYIVNVGSVELQCLVTEELVCERRSEARTRQRSGEESNPQPLDRP